MKNTNSSCPRERSTTEDFQFDKDHLPRFSGEWETRQLGEIGTFSKGYGIKRDDVSDEGVPCIRYGELYTRYQDYILTPVARIPLNVASESLPIKKGALLFAGSGETAGEIGRCAAYLGREQVYVGGDVVVLTPKNQNSLYLGYLMNYPAVTMQKARMAQGDAVVHISSRHLAQVQIELPSIEEQCAIAEALSDVDGLIQSLEVLIAKKRAIKQAAMQQLLTGKTRLPGFSGAWKTRRVGDFTDCTAGGTPSTLISEYWGGAIRWMNSGELNNKIIYDVEGRITDLGLQESIARIVPPECVLIGLAGQGKTRGTAAFNTIELCMNQSIAAIYPNESFVPKYLYYNLDSRYEELRSMSTGDGGRGGLNLQIIRTIDVPFPEIDEQTAIAAILSDMDAEIDTLERRLDKTRALKQGMMQQLLTGRIRLPKTV